MSSGVISEPPPMPVRPTSTPTPRPNTTMSGSTTPSSHELRAVLSGSSARGARVARRRAALTVLLVVRAARAARVRPAGGAAARVAGLLLRVATLGGRAALGVHLVLRDVLAVIVHASAGTPGPTGAHVARQAALRRLAQERDLCVDVQRRDARPERRVRAGERVVHEGFQQLGCRARRTRRAALPAWVGGGLGVLDHVPPGRLHGGPQAGEAR